MGMEVVKATMFGDTGIEFHKYLLRRSIFEANIILKRKVQ